jgi:hypothetical protein
MSDFVNSGWSVYVAGVTVVGLICLAAVVAASKRKVMPPTTPPATSGTRTCAR